MNRRRFMAASGVVAGLMAFAGSGCWTSSESTPEEGAQLEDALCDLADPLFAPLATRFEERDLRRTLSEKGVLSADLGLDTEKLRELARSDEMVAYRGYYYTATELELYAIANIVAASR